MRFTFAGERVLAVVAHPDDAELLCAGTLARARADGATVGVCVLCKGDKGQPTPPIHDLEAVRRAEMKAAAALLGAELLLGDFGDAELYDGVEARLGVVERFRRFQPTLVLAHHPDDYHADHRAAAALAEAASWLCASAGFLPTSPPVEVPPALWWMDAIQLGSFLPGFYVDVSDYLDLKRQMLACHKSQLLRGADRAFAPLEELMIQQCTLRGAQAGVRAAEAFQVHRAWKRCRAW
jgi:N-acetylglucosamine malate deacetylase 1